MAEGEDEGVCTTCETGTGVLSEGYLCASRFVGEGDGGDCV